MWDLPDLGIEPVFLALTGKFFTTEPPGKPPLCLFLSVQLSGIKYIHTVGQQSPPPYTEFFHLPKLRRASWYSAAQWLGFPLRWGGGLMSVVFLSCPWASQAPR